MKLLHDICKTKRVRVVEIVLMERAVNLHCVKLTALSIKIISRTLTLLVLQISAVKRGT